MEATMEMIRVGLTKEVRKRVLSYPRRTRIETISLGTNASGFPSMGNRRATFH